jgi:hypothetical protein
MYQTDFHGIFRAFVSELSYISRHTLRLKSLTLLKVIEEGTVFSSSFRQR